MIEIVIPENERERERVLDELTVRVLEALGWRFETSEHRSRVREPEGNVHIDHNGQRSKTYMLDSIYHEAANVAYSEYDVMRELIYPAVREHGVNVSISTTQTRGAARWLVSVKDHWWYIGIATAPIGYLAAAITAAWLEWHEARTAAENEGE